MPPLSIDIVVCTYDNAALLDRTLAAIGRQRVPDDVEWRVIVVDNNCTDDTPAVVERHAAGGGPPVRRVVEPVQGLTPARVRGVRSGGGEWVAFVDDDSLLDESWIAEAARFVRAHPDCGAFGGRIVLEWEEPPPAYVSSYRYAYAGKNHGDRPHRRPWVAGTGLVARRAALVGCGWVERQYLDDRIGGRLVSGGDMELALRLAARYELWYNPACRLRHVIPARRTTRDYLRRMVRGLGESRHNATALAWRGSYATWLPWSALYSLGFAIMGIAHALRAAPRGLGVDPRIALAPALGWWQGMGRMWTMDRREREALVGLVAAPPPAPDVTLRVRR